MRTSRRLLRQVRRTLMVAFLFSGFVNILMLATPLYILQVFETVVPTGSLETLVVLTGMVAFALLCLALIEVVRDRILLRAGLWLDHEVGRQLLDNGIKAGQSAADLNDAGRAVERLRSFITSPAILPLFDAPFVPFFVLILFVMHPAMGALAAAAAVVLFFAVITQLVTTSHLNQEATRSYTRAARWWHMIAQREAAVGALGLGPGATQQWERMNRGHVGASYAVGKRTGTLRVFARTIRTGAQTGVYAIGAWLVINGELSAGALVASAILLAKALGPLEQFVGSARAIQTGVEAYRLLKAQPADAVAPRVADDEGVPGRQLNLSDVTFYQPGRKTPAVRSVSFTLPAGQSLGIVGANGSGKSTLAGLIAGAYSPSAGSAELDGIAIVKWQRMYDGAPPIGYIPDEPVLIEGTVHDNIVRFADGSLWSAVRAAQQAGVHDILQALNNGYDTQVGPFGSGLSLREKRAVAFARAVHIAPRILVLDEPEAGLDGASLRALTQTLRSLKENGTTLVVATQDPRILRLVDKVALLNGGSLQAFGASDEMALKSTGTNGAATQSASPPPNALRNPSPPSIDAPDTPRRVAGVH